MDTRVSSELANDVIYLCKPPPTRIAARTRPVIRRYNREKRHATYFPSKASFDTKWNFSDDDSTWEFSAPVPISRSSTDTCSSASSTPAQEIVLRYRAEELLDNVLTGSSLEALSSEVSHESWETAPLGDASMTSEPGPPVSEKDDLKVLFRQSRHEALLDTVCR